MSNIPAHLPPVADAMTAADLRAHMNALLAASGAVHCTFGPLTCVNAWLRLTTRGNVQLLDVEGETWADVLISAWNYIAATPEREASAKAARLDALRAEIAALEGAVAPARREVA